MDEKEIKAVLQSMNVLKKENESQTKVIMKLQDQIRFLKFDKTEMSKTIEKLKYKASSYKKTKQQIKTDIEKIIKDARYEDLKKVLALLNSEGDTYDIE